MTQGCEHIRQDFSALLDGELDTEARASLEEHLANCTDCLRELDLFKRVNDAYNALPRVNAPDNFETLLRARLDSGAAAQLRFTRWFIPLAAAAGLVLTAAGLYAFSRAEFGATRQQLARGASAPDAAAPGGEAALRASIPAETAEQLDALGYLNEEPGPEPSAAPFNDIAPAPAAEAVAPRAAPETPAPPAAAQATEAEAASAPATPMPPPDDQAAGLAEAPAPPPPATVAPHAELDAPAPAPEGAGFSPERQRAESPHFPAAAEAKPRSARPGGPGVPKTDRKAPTRAGMPLKKEAKIGIQPVLAMRQLPPTPTEPGEDAAETPRDEQTPTEIVWEIRGPGITFTVRTRGNEIVPDAESRPRKFDGKQYVLAGGAWWPRDAAPEFPLEFISTSIPEDRIPSKIEDSDTPVFFKSKDHWYLYRPE